MAIFFNKQSLPPIEDLLTGLMSANQFLHPEWNEQETIFNSIHAVRTIGNSHKRIANYVNEVCKSAVIKLDEVNQLEQQLQLNTDINN